MNAIPGKEINMDETNPSVPGASEVIEAGANTPELSLEQDADISDDLGDIGGLEAAAEELTPKQVQELKKKLKIKVDGEEFEEELDFNDEEGLKRHIQKAKAFDKRAKEFSKYKADVDSLLSMLQSDPEALLEKMGINVDDLSERRLSKRIEEMQKSPEQIEAEKMRKRLEEYEAKEKELQARAEAAEFERMKDEHARQIEAEITEAMEVSTIPPKNDPEVYQQIGQLMAIAMSRGIENVTPKMVIPYVEKAYERRIASIIQRLDDAGLEKLLSKERLDQYRKNKVAARKPVPQTPKAVDTGSKTKAEDKPKQQGFRLNSLLSPRK